MNDNIVTTRNKDFGTNELGVLPRYNMSLNVNHRKGRLNLFGNAAYNNIMVPWNSTGSRLAGASMYDQYAIAKNFSHNLNYKAGVDFYADKKSTFGFLVSGNTGHWENAVPMVRSVTGNVDLVLATNQKAGISMQTTYGRLFSDFDISKDPPGDAKNIMGKINGGGSAILLKTVGGNINLPKPKSSPR